MKDASKTASALILAAGLAAPGWAAPKKDARVSVELYVMSLCPFGVQAENGLLPAARTYEKQVDLNLGFIAGEQPGEGGQPPKFSSLHGQPEVDEDLRQLCVKEKAPAKFFDYILERDKNPRSQDWQAAAKAAGVDPAPVEACAGGAEGAALLSKNLPAARARNASGSPTIYIDGAPYNGGRTTEAFAWALCGAMKAKGLALPESCVKALAGPKPAGLAGAGGPGCDGGAGPSAPPKAPTAFDIWAVRDPACKECELTLLDGLKRLHPAAVIKTVDAGSPEGKALVEKHRPRALPLYVLDRKVEQEQNFNELLNSRYARSADQYVVKPGPDSYLPSEHVSRPLRPRHLDIFVDPFSPFAARAESELFAYLASAKLPDLTFSVHFLVQEGVETGARPEAAAGDRPRSASLAELAQVKPGPLLTARGDAGLQESLRQACLFQDASLGEYVSYLSCRNQALQDAEAPGCLRAGQSLKACMGGPEGERLLRYDARLERELGVNTSFAILWQNRYGPFGFHDVDWKRLLEERD